MCGTGCSVDWSGEVFLLTGESDSNWEIVLRADPESVLSADCEFCICIQFIASKNY